MKKSFSNIILIVISAFLTFCTIPQKVVKAALDDIEVTIHYHRFFGDYSGWEIWAWGGNNSGSNYQFTETDDYGVFGTFTISESLCDSKGIGFLIKNAAWDKDPAEDRFIPLDKVVNNKVEIFTVTETTDIYYDRSEVDLTPRFLSANFIDVNTISVSTSVPITDSNKNQFSVLENEVEITGITTTRVSDREARIKLPHSASMDKKYQVLSSEFINQKEVTLNGLFSTSEFENEFGYDGDDLGATYSKSSTKFKVWAPLASKVVLNLYSTGTGSTLTNSVTMSRGEKGVWSYTQSGDLDKTYYTYSVTNDATYEVVDPYARAGGTNGERGMVIDLSSTNPTNFTTHSVPKLEKATDAIIYETHVREFTIDSSSGVDEDIRGKYLGLAQTGTKNSFNETTGLDHLKELGITDLHLLPIFDYASVDESSDAAQFNWGYDPVNYNMPEGSYSSDPSKGEVRINELKQMIQTLHENGIRVIMDVVYNHTAKSQDSYFNRIVPGYYYRMNSQGGFSNGSGCGNETASERIMFRKFMIDSVKYWASEYRIDGFRFDLMGLHDIDTMNMIHDELVEINPQILLYGEGWTGGTSPLPEVRRAVKANAKKIPNIAVFSDDIRDSIKGSVFESTGKGYVQGLNSAEDGIRFGIVGSVNHSGVSEKGWASTPASTVTYASAHDNNTLWDKLSLSVPTETKENRIKMNNLAASIVLTSQGIPFFTAGEEMLRSKPLPTGDGVSENSYNLPDSTNSIKWDQKHEVLDTFNYYKGLIALRKAFPQFKVTDGSAFLELSFYEGLDAGLICYHFIYEETINNVTTKYDMVVCFNNTLNSKTIELPSSEYQIYVENGQCNGEAIRKTDTKEMSVGAISATVAIKTLTSNPPKNVNNNWLEDNLILVIGLLAMTSVLVCGSILFIRKNKKGEK